MKEAKETLTLIYMRIFVSLQHNEVVAIEDVLTCKETEKFYIVLDQAIGKCYTRRFLKEKLNQVEGSLYSDDPDFSVICRPEDQKSMFLKLMESVGKEANYNYNRAKAVLELWDKSGFIEKKI